MTDVYFHYSNARGWLIDPSATAVNDLVEACERADGVVRSLIMTASSEDWRSWVLHVTDKDGDQIFDLPFATVLGKPH
ncbi:hypothetical protein [Bradyrhizobium sp. BR13661]|jgi:hypothetical protein|uniref:DUF6894 family protein n=1 Tax=Bradyrhizobium sp. BR13661 TaxID=2940622 RepID=UPI0024732830|nr:hypothetical protein [Bradyrhizobium sp. BR13661]MDH6263053.1 hypothetical protein [Bradyrhizobium sp. BR13661]